MCKLSPYRPLLIPSDDKCPICGRIFDESLDHCWFCHQRFYEKENLPAVNEDIVYITITTFIGWVGSGPCYHVAVDTKLKESICAIYGSKRYSDKEYVSYKKLPEPLLFSITGNMNLLFCVRLSEMNGRIHDCSTYYFDIQKGNRRYKKAVDDFCLKEWPIMKELVAILESK